MMPHGLFGDILTLKPETIGGPVDCIWDRKALSGVAPADRTAYSQVMATLLAPQFGHLIEYAAAATEDGTRLTYDEILHLFPHGQVQSMMKNGYYVITRKEGQHLDHWHDRWAKSNIGWHRTEINSHLMTRNITLQFFVKVRMSGGPSVPRGR